MRRKAPHEALRNSAEEDRLEETGVIEKNDQPDVGPRIARRVADPAEIMVIKHLAQVFQEEKKREDCQAAQFRHEYEA